jgi:putative transposase
MLKLMDEYDHENLKIEVETSLPGYRGARGSNLLSEIRGFPKHIVVDNGVEFTSTLKYLNAKSRWVIYDTY